MTLTKKQLIDSLLSLDVPDDTIVVKASGIGFEDIYDVNTQNIVSSSFNDNEEFPAIVLNWWLIFLHKHNHFGTFIVNLTHPQMKMVKKLLLRFFGVWLTNAMSHEEQEELIRNIV